jgi:hypothetical protein
MIQEVPDTQTAVMRIPFKGAVSLPLEHFVDASIQARDNLLNRRRAKPTIQVSKAGILHTTFIVQAGWQGLWDDGE